MKTITFSQREHARIAKVGTDCLLRTGRIYAEVMPANLEHSRRVFAYVVGEDMATHLLCRRYDREGEHKR
jgi:hypothetical protein